MIEPLYGKNWKDISVRERRVEPGLTGTLAGGRVKFSGMHNPVG